MKKVEKKGEKGQNAGIERYFEALEQVYKHGGTIAFASQSPKQELAEQIRIKTQELNELLQEAQENGLQYKIYGNTESSILNSAANVSCAVRILVVNIV